MASAKIKMSLSQILKLMDKNGLNSHTVGKRASLAHLLFLKNGSSKQELMDLIVQWILKQSYWKSLPQNMRLRLRMSNGVV